MSYTLPEYQPLHELLLDPATLRETLAAWQGMVLSTIARYDEREKRGRKEKRR